MKRLQHGFSSSVNFLTKALQPPFQAHFRKQVAPSATIFVVCFAPSLQGPSIGQLNLP